MSEVLSEKMLRVMQSEKMLRFMKKETSEDLKLPQAVMLANTKKEQEEDFKKGNIGSGRIIFFSKEIKKQFRANRDWDVAKREMVLSLYMSYACLDEIKNLGKKVQEIKKDLRDLLEAQGITVDG